jgi:hypothetical protein
VEFVSNVYLENGYQVMQCNIRDITPRLQAEAQVQRQREALFQSEKLAMMGPLLAGVAHGSSESSLGLSRFKVAILRALDVPDGLTPSSAGTDLMSQNPPSSKYSPHSDS